MKLTKFWVAPDACTLLTAEQPLRLAEFDALFANHIIGVKRVTPTRLVLTLTGPPDLPAQVMDLTDRESACCSFFTFTVSTDQDSGSGSRVRLDVAVPAAASTSLMLLPNEQSHHVSRCRSDHQCRGCPAQRRRRPRCRSEHRDAALLRAARPPTTA